MLKLVVLLSYVVAVTVAAPGLIGASYGLGHEHGYVAIPAAVGHQSRVDIHSQPIIKTVVAAAPVVYTKPHYVAALPAATSHQSRVDYISKPIVYAKPVVSYVPPHLSYGSSHIASTPIVSGLYGRGLEYGHGYGHDYYGSHF